MKIQKAIDRAFIKNVYLRHKKKPPPKFEKMASCYVCFAKLNNSASGKGILNSLFRISAEHSLKMSIYAIKKASTGDFFYGVPEGIRTHDLWRRRPTLYPAELRVHHKTKLDLTYFDPRLKKNLKLITGNLMSNYVKISFFT